MINNVYLVGRLTKDVDLRYTSLRNGSRNIHPGSKQELH